MRNGAVNITWSLIKIAPTDFLWREKRTIGEILRKLCEWKGVNIAEAECCPDHIHILLEIPPKMSVSAFIRRRLPLFSPSRRFLFPAFSLQSPFLFLHPRVAQSGNGFRSRRAFWGNPRRGGARRLPLCSLRNGFPSFVCFC